MTWSIINFLKEIDFQKIFTETLGSKKNSIHFNYI